MKEIKPLLEDSRIREVRRKRARFCVQLEVLRDSELTEKDIERILAISSWQLEPNIGNVDGYEGGRSVLLRRERPMIYRGLKLKGIQLSGTGYQEIKADDGQLVIIKREEYQPPSRENFIETIGDLMGTSQGKDGRVVTNRPTYRSRGAYTEEELRVKLKNTLLAESLPLEEIVPSRVEAYGRFLNPELVDDKDLPLGFMVVASPNVNEPRIIQKAINRFLDLERKGEIDARKDLYKAIMTMYAVFSVMTAPLILGVRELHDKGRHAHLQLHLSNAYDLSKPYVMDWATMVPLDGNPEDNLINRAIDLKRPAENAFEVFRRTLNLPRNHLDFIMSEMLLPIAMEFYDRKKGRIPEEVVADQLRYRASKGKSFVSDLETIIHWMREKGIEGSRVEEGFRLIK